MANSQFKSVLTAVAGLIFACAAALAGYHYGCAARASAACESARHSRASEAYAEPAEIYATLPESVHALVFADENMRLVAQRTAPNGTFAVHIVYADNARAIGAHANAAAPVFCEAPPDLNGLLAALTHIEAAKNLSKEELAARFPAREGEVTLITPLFPEEDVTEYYTDGQGGLGMLAHGEYAYALTAPRPAVFTALRNICPAPAP